MTDQAPIQCSQCGSEQKLDARFVACVAISKWGGDVHVTTNDDIRLWRIALCKTCIPESYRAFLQDRLREAAIWLAIYGFSFIVAAVMGICLRIGPDSDFSLLVAATVLLFGISVIGVPIFLAVLAVNFARLVSLRRTGIVPTQRIERSFIAEGQRIVKTLVPMGSETPGKVFGDFPLPEHKTIDEIDVTPKVKKKLIGGATRETNVVAVASNIEEMGKSLPSEWMSLWERKKQAEWTSLREREEQRISKEQDDETTMTVVSAAHDSAHGIYEIDQRLQPTTSSAGSMTYVFLVCFVAALGGLLFGYDTGVINGAIGPLKTHFELDEVWAGWATGCALLGCALGAAGAGALSDRFGRKKVLIGSAVMFLISAIGTAVPPTITIFVIFRIIGGIGVGAASMSSPMYIAEISPARIRGRLVSVNQFAIVTGFLVVYFVNYFIALQGDAAWNEQSGWRWMFGSEALPALLLLALLFFVPESPRWLTKQKREAEALGILARVDGTTYAQAELAEIKDALAHESGSLRQLLQPGMRIILVIGIALAILQQVTGINVFLYFGTEIFKKMGSETNAALLQTVIVGAVNLTFTVIAIWTVDRLGRKPLMMIGAAGMGISLVAMGLAAYAQTTGVWMLLFILGYIACFALSVGPVTWVILSEIFPTRIRGRAMAIATVCLWIANYIISQTFPMMDENRWLVETFHRGFPFWLYGAFCAVLLVVVWRFVPETKGKSLEEIERHWMR